MNGLPYYPRYPRDFLDGTVGMTLEEKGAYGIVLDLIYMMGDRGLMDDPQFIAGHLGCSVRKWNSIKNRLVEMRKLTIENGIISNFRADKEKIIQRKYQDKQSENRSRPNKNKDLQFPRSHHTDTDTNIEKRDTKVSPKKKRGTRLSEDWALPREWGEWALSKGWPEQTIRTEADKFKDYWTAKSGKDATKLDWLATWRNWMRNCKSPRVVAGGRQETSNAKRPIADRLEARFAEMDCGEDRDPSEPLFSTDDRRPDRGSRDDGLDQGTVWLFAEPDQRRM